MEKLECVALHRETHTVLQCNTAVKLLFKYTDPLHVSKNSIFFRRRKRDIRRDFEKG